MQKVLHPFLIFWFSFHISYAQISFTTTELPSSCSANGSIQVFVTGGASPYYYQIISSSTGIIRPVQSVSTFNNLPSGSYNIRVTDKNNETATGMAVIPGNYLPLSFTYVQQQSTITMTPRNGKAPYTYTYSKDGLTFPPADDSTSYPCMSPGTYLFRVYDSCENFYTENIIVNEFTLTADINCSVNAATNIKSVLVNSVGNGNGGYSYHAYGENYDETNSVGFFDSIFSCNKNISVEITDKCGVKSPPYLVCPTLDYKYDIGCINFKDQEITITNVTVGSGIPYKYIANEIISDQPLIRNVPARDTIYAGIIDSCGFRDVAVVQRMTNLVMDSSSCTGNTKILSSYYLVNSKPASFPPTRYVSISGPVSFDITENVRKDTSVVYVNGLQEGYYVYKVINGCGDEVRDSFYHTDKCFSNVSIIKYQTCNKLIFQIEKRCALDTAVFYTLKNFNGTVHSKNRFGIFTGLNGDSCYTLEAWDHICDTTVYDTIYPIRIKLNLFHNSCTDISVNALMVRASYCGVSKTARLYRVNDFVITDAAYNILQVNTTGHLTSIPPGAMFVYARTDDCNSDTLPLTATSGFQKPLEFCLTPTIKYESSNYCKLVWNAKLMNNDEDLNLTLTGNGVSMQSKLNFFALDTGMYVLSDSTLR